MVQLYKQRPHALTNLTKVRLNPNLADGQNAQRSDLEFFIPQLCLLYMGRNQSAEYNAEILAVLLQASRINPFFCHKVHFFFQSTEKNCAHDSFMQKKCRTALAMLEDVVKEARE